ncbi:MAG: DnaA regulatory inactivator Hda [Woeseiaceae bacterium]|nr:DnaA regulatory inactivator Hda [Woeseiaceae bacterium]
MSQLALPLKLADHAIFESFHAAGNETTVAALERLAVARGGGAWIWGAGGTGKTHLLQAVCASAGDSAMYLPLGELRGADPALVDGLEERALICIDDVDRVAGDRSWEQALFRLYNALAERGRALLVASTASPRESGFLLADLDSRLKQLPVFRLSVLDDADRADALRLRARHRGLDLPRETASYLLKRSRRDMKSLYALLDTLDSAALSQQRRLTVPFVRGVLEAGS